VKVKLLSAYKLSGISQLDNNVNGSKIFVSKNPIFQATITESCVEAFDIFDRRTALGSLVLSVFTGRNDNKSAEEAFHHEISQLKAKRQLSGAFVICEGEFEMPELVFQTRSGTGLVDLTLDDFDRTPFKQIFDPLVRNVLTALKLAQNNGDGETVLIGETLYILDADREIHPIAINATAKLTIASSFSAPSREMASAIAKNLSKCNYLQRSVDLFAGSHEKETSPLFAYIAAWTALEIFVTASFKEIYQKQWYELLENGLPQSAKVVIRRFEKVMSDKLRLNDKFAVIASILAPSEAQADTELFSKLKDVRDHFVHKPDPKTIPVGTEQIQSLLKKYLMLHFGVIT
jgi:hypothetical protein